MFETRINVMLLIGLVMTFQSVFFFIGSGSLYTDLKLQSSTTNSTELSNIKNDSTELSNLNEDTFINSGHPYVTTSLVFASNIGGLLVSFLTLTMLMPPRGESNGVTHNETNWIHMIQCCQICKHICYCLNTTLFLSVMMTTWICSLGTFLILNILHHVSMLKMFQLNVLVAMTLVYCISVLPMGCMFCGVVCYSSKPIRPPTVVETSQSMVVDNSTIDKRNRTDGNYTGTVAHHNNNAINNNNSTSNAIGSSKNVNYGTLYSNLDAVVVIDTHRDDSS